VRWPRGTRRSPGVVADDRQAGARVTQAAHDLHLQAVDVLVLVHQHVVERASHARAEYVVTRERPPVQQQVVEVDHTKRALARAIGAEDLRERLAMLGTPRERLGQNLLQGGLGIDRARVHVEHRLGPREAPSTACVALLLAHVVEQVSRIAGVEHTEARREPERGRVQADHAVRDRVERAANDRAGACVRGVKRSASVRARSTISRAARRVKAQEQDPLGSDPFGQQP